MATKTAAPSFTFIRGDRQPNPNMSVDVVVITDAAGKRLTDEKMERLVIHLQYLAADKVTYLIHGVTISASCQGQTSVRLKFGRKVTELDRIAVHDALEKDITDWLNRFSR